MLKDGADTLSACTLGAALRVSVLVLVGCTPKLPLANDREDSGDAVAASAVEVLSAEDDPLLGIVVSLSGGTFQMGSAEGDADSADDEFPQHEVTLSSFAIMKREVSQGLYLEVMGARPSLSAKCDECPVEQVSWDEAVAFAAAVSDLTGDEWRLPTEAEWECAARGGEDFAYAGSDDPSQVAWTTENADATTHPGCSLEPNGYELCDMSGNVFEWVADWYGAYPSGAVTDPVGPLSGADRGYRGGAWYYSIATSRARVAARSKAAPGRRDGAIGVRLARSTPPSSERDGQ